MVGIFASRTQELALLTQVLRSFLDMTGWQERLTSVTNSLNRLKAWNTKKLH